MSFQAMTWAIKQDPGDSSAKYILLMLANYADQDDECWPSIETLAADTLLNRATILRKLQVLEQKGLVVRHKRRTPSGQDSNLYVLCVRGGSQDATQAGSQSVENQGRTVRHDPIRTEPITPPSAHARTRGRTLISPDWQPTAADKDAAASRHPELDLDAQTYVFIQHHTREGSEYADWPAAWRYWLATARPHPVGPVRSAARPTRGQQRSAENRRRADATLARLAALPKDDPDRY